jgi:type II secretory pathway component GspD/PulD (secretin)
MMTFALLLGTMLSPQEQPFERKLSFAFKDASIESVLLYVSRETGWIFVQEAPLRGTITAYSRVEVPVSMALDFLNVSLRQHGLAVMNPASRPLPGRGETLRVVNLATVPPGVHVGLEPEAIPATDEVRIQVIPLKSAGAAETAKELAEILKKAVGENGQVAVSTHSNAIILTGRSEGIHRMAEILRVIDEAASAQLKVAVFPLAHADATEAARTLNEVYRHEAAKTEAGGPPSLRNLFGAVRGGAEGDRGPAARSPAQEVIRLTPEPRTNAIIVSATDENLAKIEGLIRRMDVPSAALNTYVVRLKNTDAVVVAGVLNNTYGTPGKTAAGATVPRSALPTAPTTAPTTPSSGVRGTPPRR